MAAMKLQHVANTCMATAKVFKDKVPVSTTVKDSGDVIGYMDKKEPHLGTPLCDSHQGWKI